MRRVEFELAAQRPHRNAQIIEILAMRRSPDIGQQLVMRDDAAGMIAQCPEQVELARGKIDLATADGDAMRGPVDRPFLEMAKSRIGDGATLPPDGRPHTREEFFGPLGITNIRTFVDPRNPTHVAVMMDVPDMDALMAALETDAAAEAEANDGVLVDTLVFLVEA